MHDQRPQDLPTIAAALAETPEQFLAAFTEETSTGHDPALAQTLPGAHADPPTPAQRARAAWYWSLSDDLAAERRPDYVDASDAAYYAALAAGAAPGDAHVLVKALPSREPHPLSWSFVKQIGHAATTYNNAAKALIAAAQAGDSNEEARRAYNAARDAARALMPGLIEEVDRMFRQPADD